MLKEQKTKKIKTKQIINTVTSRPIILSSNAETVVGTQGKNKVFSKVIHFVVAFFAVQSLKFPC